MQIEYGVLLEVVTVYDTLTRYIFTHCYFSEHDLHRYIHQTTTAQF